MNKLFKKKNGIDSVLSISLLKSPPVYVQLLLGLACGILDQILCTLAVYKNIHIFLDMYFTIFASYFGLVAGLFSAFVSRIQVNFIDKGLGVLSSWILYCIVRAVIHFILKKK